MPVVCRHSLAIPVPDCDHCRAVIAAIARRGQPIIAAPQSLGQAMAEFSCPVVQPIPVHPTYGPVGYVFSHYGDYGDLIYSLSAAYDLCRDTDRQCEFHVYHHSGARHPMDTAHAAGIIPLLLAQPYIASSELKPRPWGVQLDSGIRRFFMPGGQLGDHYQNWLNRPLANRHHPWLTVPQSKRVMPVVLARSARYHAHSFPWARIVAATNGQAVFMGTPAEHAAFVAAFGFVPYYPTKDLLELAFVIAGADLFVGNQSCPRAIAEGLKVPVVVEEGTPPDTHYLRPQAWYGSIADFWPPVLANLPLPDARAELNRIADRSLVSAPRLQAIRDCVLATNHLPGAIAELGVYRGGVAKLLSHFAPQTPLHLFDTFAGVPESDIAEGGHHAAGDFVADVEEVRDYVSSPQAQYHVGHFPDMLPSDPIA